MIVIKKRTGDEYEEFARYDPDEGEWVEGPEDFVEMYGFAEGWNTEQMLATFDGPTYIAVEPAESDGDQSQEKSDGIEQLSEEIAQEASERAKEGMTSGTAGTGQATYGGAIPEWDEDDEEAEKADPLTNGHQMGPLEGELHCEEYDASFELSEVGEDDLCPLCGDPVSVFGEQKQKLWKGDVSWVSKVDAEFEEIDNTFYEIHEKIVQWSPEEGEGIEKAPTMWEGSDHIPDFVKEYIEEAFRKGAFWNRDFESVPGQKINQVRDEIKQSLTQPQGWSLSSLVENMQDAIPELSEDDAELVARQETAALANTARWQAYEKSEKEGEEFKYYWSGPQDHRTTKICEELKQATQPKRGGDPKPMDELKSIMMRIVQKYRGKGEGATPERIDEFVPHYQCRHTFVRDVQL